MSKITGLLAHLSRSQLSVQALTRLSSVSIFLLASWTRDEHLALIAFQGMLLAIPMVLMESMVGKPLSSRVVPPMWRRRAWGLRISSVLSLPVGLVAFGATWFTFPDLPLATRLLVVAPVVLQIPLEALFWVFAQTKPIQVANLVPQCTAVGTMAVAAAMASTGQSILISPMVAQIVVLAWALTRKTGEDPGTQRPPLLKALRPGSSYLMVAGIDLIIFSIALPSLAGTLAGPAALIILRALELAFGPFHVALSATTREDIVSGVGTRFVTLSRVLTVAALIVISTLIVTSETIRGLIAEDLGRLGAAVVALYCLYKTFVMVSIWASVRHMIQVAPRQYVTTAIAARAVTLVGVATSVLWVSDLASLITLLVVCEIIVMCWFVYRYISVEGQQRLVGE